MSKRAWALATIGQTLVVALAVVLVAAPRGAAAPTAHPDPQEPPGGRPPGRIDVTTSISLEEARVIIDAAVANARAAGGHPTIVVVDDHGEVVSMDRVDGTTDYFA
ncbi:MAG TPA: heme-binding protein, partial [Chloroflexota bacterium]|nr:heme-binding protein [Chloroflexota bacterium]